MDFANVTGLGKEVAVVLQEYAGDCGFGDAVSPRVPIAEAKKKYRLTWKSSRQGQCRFLDREDYTKLSKP